MKRYRNSQLRLLPQCGWAYRQRYVVDAIPQPSPSLRAGTNVHHAVALAIRELVRGGAWMNVHELAYEAVRGGDVEYTDALDVLTKITESLVEEGGLRINPKAVFLLEERLEMPIELSDGIPITFFGTPDLVERSGLKVCTITDWKSNWRPDSQDEFEADQQLPRYALLVHHHFPAFTEFRLVKRFVRYWNNVRERRIGVEDLRDVELQLVSEIEVAERRTLADDFEPTGGSWCSLCEYHHNCPLIARYRDVDADQLSIPTDTRASELAGAAIALEAAADRIKLPLKRYLGSEHPTGAVPVAGGGSYGFGPVVHRDVGVDDLREVFKGHGLAMPPELLKVDLQVLDRVRKRLPDDLCSAIDRITTLTESAQCRYRSAAARTSSPEPVAAGKPGGQELWS